MRRDRQLTSRPVRAALLIPVLDRPRRVLPLVESAAEATNRAGSIPVFICSPGDDAEIRAVVDAQAELIIVPWEAGKGDYARKLNHAMPLCAEAYDAEWLFLGADDLLFQSRWLDRCLDRNRRTGACVIGTNDLGNSRTVAGHHSTHSLVHRDYLECGSVDGPELLHEGYWHNYVDDEFVQTAMWRNTYSHARDARVEHLHPDWGKGGMDDTYRRGKAHFNDDRAYYWSRKHLWAA